LRESNATYSSNNFRLKSVPILLIEDNDIQSDELSKGFSGLVKDFPTNRTKLQQAVKNAIKAWRHELAGELDMIGLDPQTLRLYHNQTTNFISYYRLKILSREFVDNKSKKLKYIWLQNDFSDLYKANDEFNWHLKRGYQLKIKYLEKEFHDFFNRNLSFLQGENFANSVYEKHFFKNGTLKYDEPDFVNTPHDYSLRMPEIFEVKRQTQRLMDKNAKRFLSQAQKNFRQVLRYNDYFKSDDMRHQSFVKKHLGRLYSDYDLTLLMGSKSEKDGFTDLIERLKSEFEFNDIKYITYEELLDQHLRLCERLSNFNIF
jgi:hypothetical protein